MEALRAGTNLMHLLRAFLPVVLNWHPRLNARSRYFAPARPMAPGTRTPNGRTLLDNLAGWPRDRNTRLAAKTVARVRTVFSLQTATEARAKHQTNGHRSKAFNAERSGALTRAFGGRPPAGNVLERLVKWQDIHHPKSRLAHWRGHWEPGMLF